MRVIVTAARHVHALLNAHEVGLVLSLISPDAVAPNLPVEAPPRTILRFNDIAEPRDGLVLPSREVMKAILVAASPPGATLIHCHAGISRSTAAAYALACQHLGPGHEHDLAATLRALSPAATPNPLMIALADDLLEREGRMVSAIQAIGRGADACEGSTIDWRF